MSIDREDEKNPARSKFDRLEQKTDCIFLLRLKLFSSNRQQSIPTASRVREHSSIASPPLSIRKWPPRTTSSRSPRCHCRGHRLRRQRRRQRRRRLMPLAAAPTAEDPRRCAPAVSAGVHIFFVLVTGDLHQKARICIRRLGEDAAALKAIRFSLGKRKRKKLDLNLEKNSLSLSFSQSSRSASTRPRRARPLSSSEAKRAEGRK